MAAASAARLSDIAVSLVRGPPGAPGNSSVHTGGRAGTVRLCGRKFFGVEPGGQAEGSEDLGVLEHRGPADAFGGDGEELERVQFVRFADAAVGGEPVLAVGPD